MTRKIMEDDFDFVYELYMHPAVNPYLLYENMPAASFRDIFDEFLSRGVKYIFENDGKPAGMFKLIPQLHRTAHIAYLGGLAIHPQYYGKGLGQTMIAEILALGLQQGFLRIELSVATNNERAIRLYEKCGFKREGLLRKYSYLKKEDRYIDEIIMSWIDDKVLY